MSDVEALVRWAGSIDEAIVTSSIRPVETIRLRTVAEGVETSAVLDLLRSLGCPVAQGYRLGRPVPAEAVLLLSALDGPVAGRAPAHP